MFEALARGGGFDDLPQAIFRSQCFAEDTKGRTTIELAIRYGQATQESENSSQASLFGGDSGAMEIPEPPVPVCDEWDPFDKLAREKEVVGRLPLRPPTWTSSRCSSTSFVRPEDCPI